MLDYYKEKKTFETITAKFKIILIGVILMIGIVSMLVDDAYADETIFSNDGDAVIFTGGDVFDGYSESYRLALEGEMTPSRITWKWNSEGEQAWACVQYSDGNMIYFVMNGTEVPEVENLTFIDSKGIPQIIIPKVLMIPRGEVVLDLEELHRRYYGSRAASVEKFEFMMKVGEQADISEFSVLEYKQREPGEGFVGVEYIDKKTSVELQVPQGNKEKHYMIEDKVLPVEISVKALLDKASNGYVRIRTNDGLEIVSYPENLSVDGEGSLIHEVSASSGYYEEKFVFMMKGTDLGSLEVETSLGEFEEQVSAEVICRELDELQSNISLMEEGVYTLKTMSKGHEINKNFKNSIRVKQNIFDIFHQVMGQKEDHSYPAGVVSGVIRNENGFAVPAHIKFAVLDENGKEIEYFRGEHIQREDETFATVPETNVILKANDLFEFRMPVYADVYSVKPGKYTGRITIDFFGSDADLVVQEFELSVHMESQLQKVIGIAAILLSILAVLVLITRQKIWLSGMTTKEIMIIALFTAVKFALVDVSWFVMGDVLRAILGPLGPFMHIITGIFWDVINSVLLVALIYLVRKPGVVIISSVVRVILKGIAFGSFNPIAILLILSYSIIADALLYVAGFTSGKRPLEPNMKVFVLLGLIFGIQHIYSTYAFYYIWMYLYRLFYPSWYINVNALLSVVYSIVGAVCGLYLGKKLSKVVD